MITRKIRISQWTVLFLFSYSALDLEDIEEALLWADAPDSIIEDVRWKVLAGRLDEGFTYSEPSLRRTVYAVGEASSGPEVLDSTVHEIFHIVQHVAMEDGIDIFSEEAAYLAGDISREISDIVCELSCPHCSGT
ncbi:MAG: hypothetical protein J6W09_11225 [Bacteroidales bacterium]|nr:hypothetical protein [Bacteroidales bacterium]